MCAAFTKMHPVVPSCGQGYVEQKACALCSAFSLKAILAWIIAQKLSCARLSNYSFLLRHSVISELPV